MLVPNKREPHPYWYVRNASCDSLLKPLKSEKESCYHGSFSLFVDKTVFL